MEQHTCSNCGTVYTGNFCNQCGQKQVHRYTIAHVLHELVHVFTHADKGIFRFAANIIVRPGLVALDFVEGRRKRHFNLFQYLIIIVGIATLLISKTKFMEDTINSMNEFTGTSASQKQQEFQQGVVLFMKKYFNIVLLATVPAFALFSWLFINRSKYNFAENVVLFGAVSAQTNTVSIVSLLLMALIPAGKGMLLYTIFSFAVLLTGFSLGIRQFHKLSWIKSISYGLVIYICAYIVQVILVAIITIIYMIFMFI
jgi:hypothetical protein